MKILIAPDSFKGSLSAVEICNLFLSEIKGLDIEALPLADGGEGSLQAISVSKDFEKITLPVSNPLFEDISALFLPIIYLIMSIKLLMWRWLWLRV